MRVSRSLAFLIVGSAVAVAQTSPQKGPELTDMDRKVEACTDFYEFSNGAWRAMNPIPA